MLDYVSEYFINDKIISKINKLKRVDTLLKGNFITAFWKDKKYKNKI